MRNTAEQGQISKGRSPGRFGRFANAVVTATEGSKAKLIAFDRRAEFGRGILDV